MCVYKSRYEVCSCDISRLFCCFYSAFQRCFPFHNALTGSLPSFGFPVKLFLNTFLFFIIDEENRSLHHALRCALCSDLYFFLELMLTIVKLTIVNLMVARFAIAIFTIVKYAGRHFSEDALLLACDHYH